MNKTLKIYIIALICLFLIVDYSHAAGLRTHFVEVRMDNIEPGRTYSVKETAKKPLIIENVAKKAVVNIEITPERPASYNLTAGYEPIPDLSWIALEKSYFENVGPGGKIETDIHVTIPEKKEYYGSKYEAYLYSHTVGKTGYKTGLMSRLLIETAKYPE